VDDCYLGLLQTAQIDKTIDEFNSVAIDLQIRWALASGQSPRFGNFVFVHEVLNPKVAATVKNCVDML